jgi:PAS domain S-box-containing protein
MLSDVHLDILIVEDDADTRANLRDILELDDYRIREAATVAEALDRDDWSSYLAILLDRRLPDGSASDLLPTLRRLAPAAPVIVMTGFADVEGAISALRQGAADYLLKPINPDELRARIGRIAEHTRAEKELQRRSLMLQSVLAHVSDAAVVADREGTILLCSPTVERLIGSIEIGASLRRWAGLGPFYDPETLAPIAAEDRPLTRTLRGEEVIDMEVLVRPPGKTELRWLSASASPIRNDDGIQGGVVIFRDITERKEAAEEIRRERDLAEGLIAGAPAIVLLLDAEGRIVRFNPYMEEISGYSLEQVRGRNFFQTFLPERDRARIQELFARTIQGADTSGTINSIMRSDDREREIRWSNRLLMDAAGHVAGVLAIGQDITDLREAQQRAVQAERLAAIGQMVAGLAHESRNALQRTQACLEMLALEVGGRPRALDLIARIQRAQDDLHRLYEDVRDYAAPIALRRDTDDLIKVWRNAWADLESSRRGRDATLREQIDNTPTRVSIDPFRMEQVFRNLLENALAACPDPVVVEIRCTSGDLNGTPALRITVRDNGPGLSSEQAPKVFDAFYTTKTKGTGLGLAICRRIIEAHGGQLLVGEPARGAEFVVVLPLAPSA